ncbi:MAG: porin [Acetobacteraceae bacterium]|nr:porin [Acetobacteraceae bacterium]
MRKLLLATVAGLGSWGAIATDASAQNAVETPMQTSARYMNYSGGAGLPTAAPPAPGTVVVRLNGRVRFYAYEANDGDVSRGTATTLANKQDKYGFAEYGRLYPGFDGVAANGLKYGASLEIRQDTNAPAGGGVNGSISGQDPKRANLYFRRVWGYLGADQVGTVRLGSTDQPTSLYLTGNFENFNDGGWNGDLPGFFAGNAQVLWPFSDVGSYYTTNKIVYLSPQIFGFDLGASYEPSTANVSGADNCNAPGLPFGGTFNSPAGQIGYCDRASSTGSIAESARRRNTFDVLVRYRGTFGPVGVAATAAYIGGGHVGYNGSTPFTNNPLAATGAAPNYQGLSIGDFGAAVTIAGLSVGGHYTTGRYNGNVANTLPSGLQGSNAWLAGASYTFGPVIVGASYFVSQSAGDLGNAFFGRQRREVGVAAGGTYALAPGISIFLSYLYGERKQNGYDFVSGAGVSAATGAGGTATGNKINVSGVSLGTAFSW